MDPIAHQLKRGVAKTKLLVPLSGDLLLCTSCRMVPNPETATEHKDCGSLFCLECSDKWLGAKEPCPGCKGKATALRRIKTDNKVVHRLMGQLKLVCPLAPESEPCSWQGDFVTLSEHFKTCEHLVLTCTQGCGHKCPRKLMARHEAEECAELKRTCPHCQNLIKVTELAEHIIACPMNPESVLPCKYSILGCGFKGKTKERGAHEVEHDKEHFEQGLAAIEMLTKKLAACQAEESKVKLAPGSLLKQARANEYTTTVHQHPLKLFKQTGSWPCSGKELPAGCAGKSGLIPSIAPRYHCEECHFDLCIKCLETYIIL